MSTNHIVEYKGEKYTLAKLAETYNLNYNLIKSRIRYNWNINDIVEKPKKG